MSGSILVMRAVALEQEFVKGIDQQLLVEVQNYFREATNNAVRLSLTVDQRLMEELQSVQITPLTLMALSLFPAIHVAWASGKIEPPEKDALLKAADHLGIDSSTPAFAILQSWLERQPSAELFEAWKAFIQAVRSELSESAFAELQKAAMTRSRTIAEAAGGFLGIHKVSHAETTAIAELQAVFATVAK